MAHGRSRNRSLLLLGLGLSLAAAEVTAGQETKGHLFIIGGGRRAPEMMARLVELAGGVAARIAVIPNASSVPLEVGPEQAAELQKAGAGTAFPLVFGEDGADSEELLVQLEGANAVFFSGGDQSRLTRDLLGTKLLDAIRQLYAEGGVVAGTSAGAAVMSGVMITGDEERRSSADEAFTSILRDNVVTAEGFGLLAGVIVDQHFIARKRHNRLLSLVLERPELLGVGIDESTAIVVDPGGSFEVVGIGQVAVYDASKAEHISSDAEGHLSAEGLVLHLLRAGQRFDLAEGKVLRRREPEGE